MRDPSAIAPDAFEPDGRAAFARRFEGAAFDAAAFDVVVFEAAEPVGLALAEGLADEAAEARELARPGFAIVFRAMSELRVRGMILLLSFVESSRLGVPRRVADNGSH